jgi:hypothetical protein
MKVKPLTRRILISLSLFLAVSGNSAATQNKLTEFPTKVKINKNMDNSESKIIENVNIACDALAFQSNDPNSIAAKFGAIIENIPGQSQKIKPLDPNLESVSIGIDNSSGKQPYPAYSIELSLNPILALNVKTLEQVLGEYKEAPRRPMIPIETIVFHVTPKEASPKYCRVLVDYKRSDNQAIKDGIIVSITVLIEDPSPQNIR